MQSSSSLNAEVILAQHFLRVGQRCATIYIWRGRRSISVFCLLGYLPPPLQRILDKQTLV